MTRAAAALGLLLIGLAVTVGPAHHLAGVALVVTGLVLLWTTRTAGDPGPTSLPWSGRERIVLLAVLGFSLFLRLWRLGDLPPPLWSDEAQHGLDALRIITQRYLPLYFPANCGQEPLYKYLVAAALSVAKNRVVAVRLPAALAGTALVVVGYLLARRLWGPRCATLAGALLSFSSWPVHFSRIAFRASLAPPIAASSVLVLVSGRTRLHAALSGALSAVLLYTYPAFRLFPVIPVVWMLSAPSSRSWGGPRRGRLLVAWLLAFLIVALPLLTVACARPGLFLARAEMASIFSESDEPLSALGRNIVRHLGMLTFDGDHNPRHNVPGVPMLSPLIGLMFLAGIVLMARKHRRTALLLLIWLAVMMVPGVLSVERQAPHCLRSLGVLPVPYLFAGYAISLLGDTRRARTAVAIVLLAAGVGDTLRYWDRWPRALASVDARRRSLYSFNEDEATLAQWLANRVDPRPVRLSPQLYLHPTVAYLAPPQTHSYRMLRHSDQLGDGPAVLCMVERNLWWMRDDSRKQFFDWWYAAGLVSEAESWEAVVRTYPRPCDLGVASDVAMMDSLLRHFPDLRLSRVGVFVCAETESMLVAPGPGSLRLPCVDVRDSSSTCTGWVRFPPGAFTARVNCGSLRVDIREWCVGPATSHSLADGHGRVDLEWPAEVQFAVGSDCGVRWVGLSFAGPGKATAVHPAVTLIRRFKAALHRRFRPRPPASSKRAASRSEVRPPGTRNDW